MNSAVSNVVCARTATDIVYRPNKPAFALIDFDSKGMPKVVAAKITKLGGTWAALVSVMPELGNVARVTRRSTSAGLLNGKTGKKIQELNLDSAVTGSVGVGPDCLLVGTDKGTLYCLGKKN